MPTLAAMRGKLEYLFFGVAGTLAALVVSCGAEPYVPVESRLLGLNDATLLLPLEGLDAQNGLPAPETMIPRALFDRLSTEPGDVITELARLRLVGVRFEVCDRHLPGPCPTDADGSLRLVLQPILKSGDAEDVAFHAFYPLPRAEMPQVVDELRALARMQDVPRGSALRVNTAFQANPAYRQRLAALVGRYAQAPRLLRLTLFGQLTNDAALAWVFRGIELKDGRFERIRIPGIDAEDQFARLFSPTSYTLTPVADAPPGFVRVITDADFEKGSDAEKTQALDSLVLADNPTRNNANTVQCASCHLATTVLGPRARDAGIALESLENRFTSRTFDLTPPGEGSVRYRTLRALGYLQKWPLVSQRVVNETAGVLEELEQRYPPAK